MLCIGLFLVDQSVVWVDYCPIARVNISASDVFTVVCILSKHVQAGWYSLSDVALSARGICNYLNCVVTPYHDAW